MGDVDVDDAAVVERESLEVARKRVLHAEAAVLGGMLNDIGFRERALDELTLEDFQYDAHRDLFRVISIMDEAGDPVHPTSIADFWVRDGGLTEQRAELLSDVDEEPAGAAAYHLGVLREEGQRREARDLADEFATRAEEDSPDAVWEWLSAKAEEARSRAGGAVEPEFDPAEFRFGRFLESEPPEREWVIKDTLPLRIVGILGSMGGAGKSLLMYLLGFSVTTGLPFLDMPMGPPGGFLYLAAEDDEDELHRRGRALLNHYRHLAELAGEPFDADAVAERLHVVPRVADDNLLTSSVGDGEVRRTALVERLIMAAQRIPDLRMIVVDPVSRYRGGKANHEEDATRFVEALEAIRMETGATVLGLSHVNQLGIREGGGQEIIRGSTGLPDGVRWVATLQKLRKDRADAYGIHEDEAGRYLRLDVPKSNYTAPFPGMWLRREAGGVLVPAELEKSGRSEDVRKAQKEYVAIVGRIQKLLQDEGPLTRTQIRPHCGLAGALGAGDKTVRSVIERGVREGDLVDVRGELHPPVGDGE